MKMSTLQMTEMTMKRLTRKKTKARYAYRTRAFWKSVPSERRDGGCEGSIPWVSGRRRASTLHLVWCPDMAGHRKD